jgi:hypothetical protein
MQDFSKRALMAFLDTAIAKGRINANTGSGMRAACKKILEQVADDDDVRRIDIQAAVVQYNNRHPGVLSPESLRVYESRARAAIENLVQSITDPTGYKPPAKASAQKARRGESKPAKEGGSKPAPAPAKEEPEHSPPSHQRFVATDTSLAMPFPLRPTFLAQVVIPRDLTKDEARRLSAFIDSLAHDPPAK